MTYFSLLYQSKQQETQMKASAKKQLFISERKESERVFQLVGSKMVRIDSDRKARKLPCYFVDLNLNQVMDKILQEDTEDDLTDIFYELIHDKALINYRQNVFKDLEKPLVYEHILSFYSSITQVTKLIQYASKANHKFQQSKYLLDAIDLYQDSLINLVHGLDNNVFSDALQQLHCILQDYCDETSFINTSTQAKSIKERIESIYYNLTLSGDRIKVSFGCKDDDYSKELRQIFCRTDEKSIDHPITFFHQIMMNELELQIVDTIGRKYGDLFTECMEFTMAQHEFVEPMILRIHKEFKFYLACHDYIQKLKQKDFPFTYPDIEENRSMNIKGLYDVNLAFKAIDCNKVVPNDFILKDLEFGAWITGANQGGKTTYARSIGQVVYLTLLGLPAPAAYARIPLFSSIFTHFTAEEDAVKSNGKLKEELLHIKELMDQAHSANSLFIFNELFSSATSSDAFDMSRLLIRQLRESGHMVICVTHIPRLADDCDQMASLGTQTSDSPNHERTYHIIRKKAELTAYAFTIAKKYHLTLGQIKERLGYEN